MKKFNDIFKILIAYITSSVLCSATYEMLTKGKEVYKYYPYMKGHVISLIIFTVMFLLLIRVFKVNVRGKAMVIFIGVMLIITLISNINMETLIGIGCTPDDPIIILPVFIVMPCIVISLPFVSLNQILIKYDFFQYRYIIVPLYLLMLVFFSDVLSKIPRNSKET